MAEQTVLEKYYLALVEFLLLSKRCVIEIGDKYNLTAMQSITLLLLGEPRPMHSFTKIFNCDASNVTGIVDGLERKKMVSRYENSKDRRIKMIKLEPKGVRIRNRFITSLTGDRSYIPRKLDDKETAQFTKLLAKITSD